jgi:hypothetical protein
MLKSLFSALKWTVLGLATGQLVSGYTKDKNFKSKVDSAKWLDKLKVAGEYLVSTNKKLIDETDIDSVVKNVKKTATQAHSQIKSVKSEEVIENVKTQAKHAWDSVIILLQKKLLLIEDEVVSFEENAKGYAEDTWTEYYRQLASKFALFKKSVTKYVVEWAIAAEEQFELEKKIKYLGEKLEGLKTRK